MRILIARSDERLIHGKIISEWCQNIKPERLVIVDDELYNDEFMTNLYQTLVPLWLKIDICSINLAIHRMKDDDSDEKMFILCREPSTYVKLVKGGVFFEEITLADKRYFPNKIEIDKDQMEAIEYLIEAGVRVVAKELPDAEEFEVI